jgi:hypothetical protein
VIDLPPRPLPPLPLPLPLPLLLTTLLLLLLLPPAAAAAAAGGELIAKLALLLLLLRSFSLSLGDAIDRPFRPPVKLAKLAGLSPRCRPPLPFGLLLLLMLLLLCCCGWSALRDGTSKKGIDRSLGGGISAPAGLSWLKLLLLLAPGTAAGAAAGAELEVFVLGGRPRRLGSRAEPEREDAADAGASTTIAECDRTGALGAGFTACAAGFNCELKIS